MPFLLKAFIILSYIGVFMQHMALRMKGEPIRVKDLLVLVLAPFNLVTILTFWLVSKFVSLEEEVF